MNRASIADAFHAEHERVYGHADRSAPLQVIALRLVISGKTAKPALPAHTLEPGPAPVAAMSDVWIDGRVRATALYHRAALRAGQSFAGPAVVAQDDCTTVIPPGFSVRVDEYTNLRIVAESAQ
jgi:N-methylhydantoinase A